MICITQGQSLLKVDNSSLGPHSKIIKFSINSVASTNILVSFVSWLNLQISNVFQMPKLKCFIRFINCYKRGIFSGQIKNWFRY